VGSECVLLIYSSAVCCVCFDACLFWVAAVLAFGSLVCFNVSVLLPIYTASRSAVSVLLLCLSWSMFSLMIIF
jgi:hypothetical protein